MNIAITAPAGPVKKDKLKAGVQRLKKLGYENITIGDTCAGSHNWNSAEPEKRALEFESFWCNPKVDLVMAARGGFGCLHLLNLLDWDKMKKHKKLLCGHSDLTVMHLAFMKHRISSSISGIMPAVEFASDDLDEFSISSFEASLTNFNTISLPSEVINQGSQEGAIIPVTLSVLCSMIGTGSLPNFKDAILCLEDVNEPVYRLDAYLSQLELSGIFEEIGGLIWGDFNECGSSSDLDILINRFSKKINGPVVRDVPFGHCLPRMSLPAGKKIIFKVNKESTIESLV